MGSPPTKLATRTNKSYLYLKHIAQLATHEEGAQATGDTLMFAASNLLKGIMHVIYPLSAAGSSSV